jgi:hypothetical protein
MGRITTAFRLFFKVLGNATLAREAEGLLEGRRLAAVPAAGPATPPAPAARTRSDALTLLEVLQREARLIDFLKEDLSGYADAQIGAAARDVHRDAAAALERLFALRPLRSEGEGSSVEAPAAFDASRFRLTGNVTGDGPYRGTLRHPGWQATRSELPAYTGGASSALVIAPAEVEVA